ncbi:GNAT family N-acetyltransferase [Lysinibacillus sp. G01H]|uniref:GNAT family N-acetyltransferase n=1 Tax=Lysinibacillus sp. G01H TaxID=3026425 RepID=UPI00237D5382|nr:GNAT family N-acetyltransferase [Lysinibacillus sp. G01H]WDU80361.1 GNAT family N-acetyltransferase [Lysinibacillus sp. G01H]
MKIMSTNCIIEQLQPEHFTDIQKLYSNKQVRTYLGGVPSNSYIEASFKGMLEAPFPNTYLYITLKETGEFIGLVSIDEYHDKELYELSYQFLPQFWGRGLAFEVLTQVIQDGLNYLNIESIVAETQTANKASCRLLEKLGMKNVQMLERFGQEQAVYELSKNNEPIRQIIALSGGGFSQQTPSFIDEYILRQTQKNERVKICFIPTASNDAQGYIEKFYAAFHHCEATHILQKDMRDRSIREKLLAQHIIYVGGGNTGYLLEKWREYGFDELLKEVYQKGIILAGISAGAMCWFEKCFSENTYDDFEEWNGLGLLSGIYCPHYNDQERRYAFDRWIENHPTLQEYTLIDTETLHFRNERLVAKIQSY